MTRTLLVVGATGALGSRVARVAQKRGWQIRAFVRDPSRLSADLRAGACAGDARDTERAAAAMQGVDAVFSSAGASAVPGLRGWRGYKAVDVAVHRSLIGAATRAGVGRFIYVSVTHPPAMRRIVYVDAHERVAELLAASPLSWGVVRPTGFFSAVGAYLDLARRGTIPEIGGGDARTNPIADDDLAEVCADAVEAGDPRLEVAAGGPEILTRRAIGELAFAALGRPPRFRYLPPLLVRTGAALLRPIHPRMSQLVSFITALGAHDVIAPVMGQRRLGDHFAAVAGTTVGSVLAAP